MFALEGFREVKIERLAKKVGVSKSSFYHYFADLETFMEHLLAHHVGQARILAEKEQQARNISPELIDILLEHKTDLLFNRELRIYRSMPAFANVLEQSNAIVGDSFVNVWVKELNLHLTPPQLASLFELALENFFLQINAQNLTREWLSDYFANLKRLAGNFR